MSTSKKPRELYNPQTGARLDLEVHDEPEAVAAARWTKKRRAYLQQLVDDPTVSDDARASYQRELKQLA